MAQFDALATFAQFGAEDLDPVTRRQLARGERFRELLKQDENAPVSFENMVARMIFGSAASEAST